MPTLILASGSPRRADLLRGLRLTFEVVTPDVDESVGVNESPVDYVRRVAEAKAVAGHRPDAVTIAADTSVVWEGRVFGKPASPEDADAHLRALAGRAHDVLTAVAVRSDGPRGPETRVALERAAVTLAPMTDTDRTWYVATGEPRDKAGSYAVQGIGGLFVEDLRGNPQTVIGLPLAAVRRLVRESGHDLLDWSS